MSAIESTAEKQRPAPALRKLPRLSMTSRRWTIALLIWGAIVAVAGAAYLDQRAPDPLYIQSGRADDLRASLQVLEEGGPPLVKHEPPAEGGEPGAEGRYVSVGLGDDQGLYLYVPVLAHWLGVEDPIEMLRWLMIALFAAMIVPYPLIFSRLFDSVVAGVIAAPALLASLPVFAETGDLYWITAWAVFALLPPVLLIARRWPRGGLAWLVLILLGASFANSIRSNTGLPILLAAAIVILWQPWRWRRRGAGIAALVAAYLAISGLGMTLAREYRDNRAGDQGLTVTGSTVHVVWHSLYIGLGFQPNDHGIKWSDTVASDAAQRENPGVEYASAEYEDTVRKVYLDFVTDEPGFFLAGTAEKAMVTADRLTAPLGILAFVVPLMLLFGAQRRLMRGYLVLIAPALVVFFFPPVLTIPSQSYQVGWIASIRLLGLLALAWLIVALQREVPWLQKRRAGLSAGELRAALRPLRRIYAAAGSTVACWLLLVVSGVLGPRAEQDFCDWQVAPPNPAPAICPLSP
jgi:hypothetical protein